MPISTTLVDFRTDNACNITQLPDTVGLRYYNDSRDIVIDEIIKKKEDYFYNEIRADIVAGNREYTFPKRGDLDGLGNPIDGLLKLKGVSVKWKSTDTEYSKLTPGTLEILDYDLLSYAKTNEPFYAVSDNSVFLYPTPTESITAGLIMYGIFSPKKLLLASEETLPDNISKVILLGIAERWFTSQKQYNEANTAGAKFRAELDRVTSALSGRIQSPIQRKVPNLSHLA